MNIDKKFLISDDKNLLQIESICNFLGQSDWASKRPKEIILKSIRSSLCFGVYLGKKQIAFARVVTDGCTFAYLCDVFVDESYRGQGISKTLIAEIMNHKNLQNLRRFILATDNAHEIYAKFGFKNVPADKFMEIKDEDV